MQKKHRKIIDVYIKEVSKKLICSFSVKRLFLKDLKQQIIDMYASDTDLSLDKVHTKFGTPDEVARSFGQQNIEKFRRQARRLKWVLAISFIIIIILIITLYQLLSGYAGEITITNDY